MQTDITSSQAKILAMHIMNTHKIPISGTEIDFLDFADREFSGKILIKEISKSLGLSEYFTNFLVEGLEKNGLVRRRSPQFTIEERGKEILKECRDLIPEVNEIISSNIFLSYISEISYSVIEK